MYVRKFVGCSSTTYPKGPSSKGSGFGPSVKRFHGKTFEMTPYCWWFRNPANHQLRLLVYPTIYKVSYRRLAGFLPSTVCWISRFLQYHVKDMPKKGNSRNSQATIYIYISIGFSQRRHAAWLNSVRPFWLGGMSWRCCRKGSRWSKWSLSPCGAQCLSSDSGALGPISTLTVVAREAPPPWRWVLCWGSGQVYWILLVGSHHWRDAAPQLLKVAWQACRTKRAGFL